VHSTPAHRRLNPQHQQLQLQQHTVEQYDVDDEEDDQL
jgi:hypothetical protein